MVISDNKLDIISLENYLLCRLILWYYILIKIIILAIFKVEVCMSKMSKRRKRRKLSKLLKSLPEYKRRIPIAPPNITFKSKK